MSSVTFMEPDELVGHLKSKGGIVLNYYADLTMDRPFDVNELTVDKLGYFGLLYSNGFKIFWVKNGDVYHVFEGEFFKDHARAYVHDVLLEDPTEVKRWGEIYARL